MSDPITTLQLLLGLIGVMLYASALHYKQPGQNVRYGLGSGFLQNLTAKGKVLGFAGLAFVIASLSI